MATPSHVDLSVLWVPIMPETSKLGPAMEDAGKDATEHFGKGSHGLGDKIHDSFTKATDKVKDVFSKAGSDAGTSMSDSFKRETKGIEQAAADSGSKAGGSLVESFVAKTGLLKDYSGNLGTQIGGALRDKVGDALKDIPGMDGVTDSLQKVGDKAADLGADFDKTKGSIKDMAETIGSLSSVVPVLGTVAAAVGEIAAPLAAAVLLGGNSTGSSTTFSPVSTTVNTMKTGYLGTLLNGGSIRLRCSGRRCGGLPGTSSPQRRRPRLRARSTCRRFSRALLAHHQQLRTRGDGSGPPHTRTQPLAVLLVLPLAATKFLVVSSAVCPRRCPVPLTSTPPVAG